MTGEEPFQIKKDKVRKRLLKYTRKAFRMLPKLNNPRILDVGCGYGIPTIELARLSQGEVTGIDIDQPALDELSRKIKELIVTLKLGPMDQVDEEWLAQKLSIGRTPIREALFRLNAENLIEVVRGRGFFIRDITLHSIKDLFETMLILERSAVALAAKRIRPDQIENLQRMNASL